MQTRGAHPSFGSPASVDCRGSQSVAPLLCDPDLSIGVAFFKGGITRPLQVAHPGAKLSVKPDPPISRGASHLLSPSNPDLGSENGFTVDSLDNNTLLIKIQT